MKKLLLLSALLIFACSSDDNDLMEETFLERYDGVVWEINDPSVTPGLRMFNNDIQGWIEKNVNNANDEFCGQYIFGVQFEVTVEAANAFWVATLIENSENRLSYELTFVDGGDYSETVLYEVSDDGNNMSISYMSNAENVIYLPGVRTNMTQISCD
mgnify:FL=1